MNIYIESNFVLELALVQEQEARCEELLRVGEPGATIVIADLARVEGGRRGKADHDTH